MSNGRKHINSEINSDLLKAMIDKAGGLTTVAYESGVSHSALMKMASGVYESRPRQRTKNALCDYFKVQEQTLFRATTRKQKAS